MTESQSIDSPGDPRHRDHEKYLLELGRATYASIRVAGICFDILRVIDGHASESMYEDPLGKLVRKLQRLRDDRPDIPGLETFLNTLVPCRDMRNDLMHSLPVKDGLHRRIRRDRLRIRNFYSVADVAEATRTFQETLRIGSEVLYHDNGASVRLWYESGGT